MLFPLRTITAKNLAKLIEDNVVFLLSGVPELLISDNEGQYKSVKLEKLLKDYIITFLSNPLYNISPNFTEKYNEVIMISSFITDNQNNGINTYRNWLVQHKVRNNKKYTLLY